MRENKIIMRKIERFKLLIIVKGLESIWLLQIFIHTEQLMFNYSVFLCSLQTHECDSHDKINQRYGKKINSIDHLNNETFR